MRSLLVLIAVAFLAAPLHGQEKPQDVEGSKDHPMVSRFPGYVITDYEEQDFGAYEFPLPDGSQRVEGRYWKIRYEIPEGGKKAGPIQIARNYLNTFTARGGVKIYEDVDTGGGTVTARMAAGGKNIWMEVFITNDGLFYTLTIVEEAGMEQKVEFTAMELSKVLNEKGSVALHGILFDTGKATIKPESASALKPIGELLKNDPALKLEIQGHTDNVGAKAANLKLSQDRAAAVREYLVKNFGVASERLTTTGFGDSQAVADNGTEQGRAQNRRVELVKK